MRFSISTAAASMLIAGGLVAGTASIALAGFDEAQENSFWGSQSNGGATPQAATSTPAGEYRATYYTTKTLPEPAASTNKVEKDPPEFYHAKGTMGVP